MKSSIYVLADQWQAAHIRWSDCYFSDILPLYPMISRTYCPMISYIRLAKQKPKNWPLIQSASQVFRNSLWQFKWNQITWQLLGLNFSGGVCEDIYTTYIYIHIKAQYIQYVYHIYSLYMLIYIYVWYMCNILKFIFRGYFFDRQLRCCKARMRICHEISKGWLTYRPWRGKQCFDLAGWSNVPLISYKSGWWFGTRFILP